MKEKDRQIIEMANNIGKPVRLPLMDNCKGRIVGVFIDEGDPEYNACYWHGGERRTCYFKKDEIGFSE